MAQEYKLHLSTPSSARTPSRRWASFTPGRRAGAEIGLFGIACGCTDSKALAFSPSPVDPAAAPGGASDGADCYTVHRDKDALRYERRLSKSGSLSFTTTTTARSTTTSSSSNVLAKSSSRVTRSSEEEPAGAGSHPEPRWLSSDCADASSSSYSALLRELSELENAVRDWNPHLHAATSDPDSDAVLTSPSIRASSRHRQGYGAAKESSWGRRDGRGSMAVVKETEDPVGEFQRSMLAMVAHRRMTCADELQELLVWFLALNAPDNHGLVLLAFARVCQEVLPNSNRVLPEPWVRRRSKHRPSMTGRR